MEKFKKENGELLAKQMQEDEKLRDQLYDKIEGLKHKEEKMKNKLHAQIKKLKLGAK